jgi:2-oxoglutarate ferredoxin oxidoreductase subunit delta
MANKIVVNEDRCKGCLLCAHFCPQQILAASQRINHKGLYPVEQIDPEKCTACAICARMCPDAALTVYKNSK